MATLLDPVVIAQLGNLRLQARKILDGLLSGAHVNRAKGQSQEFSQHRPYYQGDEIKTIDWKVFGRADRLVVRQYQNETNIMGTLVLDDSQSMAYQGGGPVSKLDYAKTMCAALAYLCVLQNDPVSLVTSKSTLPPSAQKGRLDGIFKTLEELTAQGVWDPGAVSAQINSVLKRKTLVLIFSDLMGPVEGLMAPFKNLQAQRNEVIVFHTLDPWEIDLPHKGPVLFEDLETGETLQTEPSIIQKEYGALMKKRRDLFSQAFRSSGIEYVPLLTTTSFDRGVGRYLSWRNHLR